MRRTAQGQRGGAGDLNHVIDQLSDPASAGPLLAQLTPDEVDEMLSAASYHLESYVADAVENSITNPNRTREGLLRLADNLEDPPAEGPLRNISSTGFIDDIARLRAEAANLPVVGDWEPEAPMALPAPAPTIDVLVDEYAALPASHTSQARSEAIRGQIINNVPAVNPMSPTISDLGAMELIGATTGIRPSELLANAVTRNSTHLGMGSWSIGRRTQLQNFINQYIENQANNVQALPPALAAPLTNAITDEDVMAAIHDIRPAPLRTMLVEHYMNNGMTTREARSTARSVLDEYHANGGITGMGAGVDIRAAMRERLENERPAPAQVAPTPAQMRTMIENATPETITDIGRQLGGNHEAYGLVEFGDLTDLWVNRNTQLRNAPAMADLVNELSSLTQLVRPDMDQYARTDTLTDEIIANARPHVIPFTGAETPDEIANRIARLNPDIPPTLLAYLIGRRTTAEDVFGIRGLPDPLIHEVRAHLDTMHPANVPATNDRPALAAAVRHMLEGIQTAPSIDALSRMSTYIDGNRAAYTVPQWDVMQTMLTTRAAELRAALPAPTTQQAARTPAQMRTLIETATSLDVLQQMADYIHNNRPAYTDEQFRTLERLMTTRATEIANAGGAGFAHGGVVHMEKGGLNIRPSGSYNDYKDQYVKANRSTTGIDIDLLDKYGIGATKQKLNVTLPEGKIKQSDISELRARYKTDSGDQYGISYSPLEKRVSLSNPNPKEQSEWRADFSPMYSGISYNRNFAQGGAVEHEHLLNDIIGAMNG